MPITLITGPANAGKAQLAMEAVKRHVAHGREPLLVVPTRADVEHYLRELAGRGAAMGVRLERFAGLIDEAVRRAGVSEPLLGGLARERLLEALGSRVAASPARRGFVRALSDFVAELEVRRIDHTQDRIRRTGFDEIAGVVPPLCDDAGKAGADHQPAGQCICGAAR